MNVPQYYIERCMLGQVDSIDKLVGGLRYVRQIVKKGEGSWLEKDVGEIFANFEDMGPPSFIGGYPGKVLVGRLLPDIAARLVKPGSIKAIPWKQCGAALVIASRDGYIGDDWLAFVPLESLKDLQVEGGA